MQRNGASAAATHSTPSNEARENGHVNARELKGNMAAPPVNAEPFEDDEAPDSFCCPITHVRSFDILLVTVL